MYELDVAPGMSEHWLPPLSQSLHWYEIEVGVGE